MNKRSRYSFGETRVEHKGQTVSTFFNDPKVDLLVEDFPSVLTYTVGYVPAGYEHRPDLISSVFYNTPAFWWLLMLCNNVTDPMEGFNANDRILIPKINE